MRLGPCSVLAIQFATTQMKGEILSELVHLVDDGVVRVADAVVVRKDKEGHITPTEISNLGESEMRIFDPLDATVSGLLSNDDIRDIGELIDNNTSAGLLVIEHLWATKLAQAITNAKGKVVLNRLLMPELVEENLEIIGTIRE
jgi:uncharacterized membrane protein